MWYYKRCPKCRKTVNVGHGDPIKDIASPIMTCDYCGTHYIDKDKVEWALVPPIHKFKFLMANNRSIILLCFEGLLLIIFAFSDAQGWVKALIHILVFLVLTFLFEKYVKYAYREKIEASYKRAENGPYVSSLIVAGYPVKRLKERNSGVED